MKDGKLILIFLSVILLFLGADDTHARQTNEVKSIILEGSKLRINGTSNVNDFECFYDAPISKDTLYQTVTFGDSLFISGGGVEFRAEFFECGKRAINRDMQGTLKAKEFPFMELKLVAIEITDEVPFEAKLSITIAGTNRIEKVKINKFSSFDSTISFSGDGDILLTDFNLKPPTALFGLVKVDNLISISFDLSVELPKKGGPFHGPPFG